MIVVRRLKDGTPRYLVRYETPFGREVGKTFARKADAESWERSMKDAGRVGLGLPAPRALRVRTVVDVWQDVLASRAARWEARTRRRYEELYRLHVEPTWGRSHASAVSAREVRLWVQRLSAKGLAPATVAQTVTVLSWVMREAVEAGIRPDNPTVKARPRPAALPVGQALTTAQAARLVAAGDVRDKVVFLLAATTGLRFGELVGLNVGDVDGRRWRVACPSGGD